MSSRRKRLAASSLEELQEFYEPLLDQLPDNTEDDRLDFIDPENGSEDGSDGDDAPEYAQAKQMVTTRGKTTKVKGKNGKTLQVEVIHPGQIPDVVQLGKRTYHTHGVRNAPGEMVEAGHGFIVESPRKPWKTPRRSHCAHCGGVMPEADTSDPKFTCEFDGAPWCTCSPCVLRKQVAGGHERNRGQPAKYCSDACKTGADTALNRWRRAVKRNAERGLPPPARPQDRGRLRWSEKLRSSIEGTGHRYTAGRESPWSYPRV